LCERKIWFLGKRQTQPRKDRLRGKREESKRARGHNTAINAGN
jgi:hypothetical protein